MDGSRTSIQPPLPPLQAAHGWHLSQVSFSYNSLQAVLEISLRTTRFRGPSLRQEAGVMDSSSIDGGASVCVIRTSLPLSVVVLSRR